MDNARRQTPAYKEYMGKYALQWKRLNKDKVSKVNRSQLLKAHGLTDADYEKMVLDRDGRCDICGATPTRLCVDHCHTTMAIRGLLCTNCNLGLGYFKDSLPALENAHTYLKKQP